MRLSLFQPTSQSHACSKPAFRSPVPEANSRLTSLTTVYSAKVTTAEFESGILKLRVDGSPRGQVSVKDGRATFEVAAGKHAVELTR
jgi:hypothetical protein